jgi:hypothetical protein
MYSGVRVSRALCLYHHAGLFSLTQQRMPRPLPSMNHQISFNDYGQIGYHTLSQETSGVVVVLLLCPNYMGCVVLKAPPEYMLPT